MITPCNIFGVTIIDIMQHIPTYFPH